MELHAGTVTVLVNRRARRADRPGWLDEVRARLAGRVDAEILFPDSAAEAERAARAAAERGRAVVVAAGGDGTIHTVANGLAGTAAALGILPLGTANDLAHELGVPLAPGDAAARLVEGRRRAVDLGVVGGRRFLTVAGAGLVSASALAVTRARASCALVRRGMELLGGLSYRIAAAYEILARRRITHRMRLRYREPGSAHEAQRELASHALFVTNHRRCGGGLVVPSGGRADDGVLELCVVPATSRARLVANLQRLSSGTTIPPEVLTVLPVTSAVIELDRPDDLIADGELVARGDRFEVAVERAAMSIVV